MTNTKPEIYTHKYIMTNGLRFEFQSLIEDHDLALIHLSKLMNIFIEKDLPTVVLVETDPNIEWSCLTEK